MAVSSPQPPLHAHHAQFAQLRERRPSWRIWYVPGIGHTTWCAQPEPTLSAKAAVDLSPRIRAAEDAGDDDAPPTAAVAAGPIRRTRNGQV